MTYDSKRSDLHVTPEGWDVVPFSEFVSIQRGHDLTARQRREGSIPVMGSAGLNGFHDTSLQSGPGVVLGRSGASYGQAHWCETDFWPHNTALYVTDFLGNDPRFAYYLLRATDFSRHNSGGAQQSLNRNFIAGMPLARPPKAEQEIIRRCLDDADALIEGLERLIAKKRLIKQGAMQDLLTAKRRLPGFSGEWARKKFGEIARIRNQKIPTLGDVRAEKCIELDQVEIGTGRLSHWSGAADRTTTKYLFQPGDVLFGRLRPYLRKYFLAPTEGVCSTEIWPLQSIGVTSSFLYHVVQSDQFVAAACESYGTHMPRADWGKLLTFELDVPDDSAEQDAIGSVLLDMDAEIQVLETRLEKARQVKEGMMQNLLTGRIRLV